MFGFSDSKDMEYIYKIREAVIGKVATHLCLRLIVKELKISVEHGRVVRTLNIIFCVVTYLHSYSFFPLSFQV
jgi:hypothetical protein